MKRLTTVLILSTLFLSITACGGKKDPITTVKKGHLEKAPKITFEDLVKRYQFTDASSVQWTATTDLNNNEFVEVSVQFDNLLEILFKNIWDLINSSQMDSAVMLRCQHNFFESLLNEEGFRVEDDSSSYASLRFNMFEPDFGDMDAPLFFRCKGGVLKLDSTVDKNGLVKIEKAFLVFDIESPMVYRGDTAKYQLVYSIDIETAEKMLVNNTSINIIDI